MKLKIYALSGDKAAGLQPFVRPEVWNHPDRNQYWFLAAVYAEHPGAILGATVLDPSLPDAMLPSIGVSPKFQRSGVATAMLDRAIDLLAQSGITGLRAIYALSQQDWAALRNLLERSGFSREVACAATYTVSLGTLLAHPMPAARPQNTHTVNPASLTAAERISLATMLKNMQISPAVIQECDLTYSYAHRTDGVVDAMFLLGKLSNGSLHNLWTWASTQNNSSRGLIDLFSHAFHRAAKTCPPETQVLCTCLNETIDKLLHHFLPDSTPVYTACSYYTLTSCDDGQDVSAAVPGYELSPEDQLAAPDDPARKAFLTAPPCV